MTESDNREQTNDAEQPKGSWEVIPQRKKSSADLVWEPLTTEQSSSKPEDLDWKELGDNPKEGTEQLLNGKKDLERHAQQEATPGLRWPNGQLMSDEDQIYFRTAYSRGSMIQIGETVYPNLGYNSLQRKPGTWVNLRLSAIDDSWQKAPSPCEDGDFLDQCADGLSENLIKLWADNNFSLDLQWTIHSLSGEGAPFSFSTDNATFGADDTGTKFGEGQSLGFKLSKNFGKTFGISFGGDRIYHLDKTTDLPKNISLMGTKVIRLNDSLEPPILSLSLGIMSDVYNRETNLGTVKYPKWMRGGTYGSIFAATFDNYLEDGHAENTAGVTSAYVCAEQSVYKKPYRPPDTANKNCIKEVFFGPVASIGVAPWPWLGLYAMYNSDLNLGISFKPFKEISWQFGFELVAPIKGLNPGLDDYIGSTICPNDDESFGSCRTRLGFFTDLSF